MIGMWYLTGRGIFVSIILTFVVPEVFLLFWCMFLSGNSPALSFVVQT